MIYTPPNGNAIHFNLIGPYYPPSGSAINFDLLGGIQLTLDSTLESSSAYFQLLASASERELSLVTATQDISPTILVKSNDGLYYTVPTSVLFNFTDDGYEQPNGRVVPFQFNKFYVNFFEIRMNPTLQDSTLSGIITGIPENALASLLDNATAEFLCHFYDPYVGTLSFTTDTVSRSFNLTHITPRTGVLSKTLDNVTLSIIAVCQSLSTVDLSLVTQDAVSDISLETAIAIDVNLSANTESVSSDVSLKTAFAVDVTIDANTGSATYRQWLNFYAPITGTLSFTTLTPSIPIRLVFVKTNAVYLDAFLSDAIALFNLTIPLPITGNLEPTLQDIILNGTLIVRAPLQLSLDGNTESVSSNVQIIVPEAISLRVLANTGTISSSISLYNYPPTSGNLSSTVSINTRANFVLLKQLFGRWESFLDDSTSSARALTFVGTLHGTTPSANLRGIGATSYGQWSSYLASIRMFSLFYQVAGKLDGLTSCSMYFHVVTPMNIHVEFEPITPSVVSLILIEHAQPVEVIISATTPDVFMKMLKEIGNRVTFLTSILDKDISVTCFENRSYLLDLELEGRNVVSLTRELSKDNSFLPINNNYKLLSEMELSAVFERIFYELIAFDTSTGLTVKVLNRLLDKEVSENPFRNYYRLLSNDEITVPKQENNALLDFFDTDTRRSIIYSIVSRVLSTVTDTTTYGIDTYREKEIIVDEIHRIEVLKEKTLPFYSDNSLKSLILKNFGFFASNRLETVREKFLELSTTYDILLPTEFETTFIISYSKNTGALLSNTSEISYFGDTRNFFYSATQFRYDINASESLENITYSEHEYIYSRHLQNTVSEYSLDALQNIFIPFIEEYSSSYSSSGISVIPSYSLWDSARIEQLEFISGTISLKEDQFSTTLLNERIYKQDFTLFSTNYGIDTKQLADTITEVAYELESPSVSIIYANTGNCSASFRIMVSNGITLAVTTDKVSMTFEVMVQIYNLMKIIPITPDVVMTGLGYHVCLLKIDAILESIKTNIISANFYSTIDSTTQSVSVTAKGFGSIRALINARMDSEYYSYSKADFRLIIAENYLIMFTPKLENVSMNALGLGHSVAMLLVPGEANSKYNITHSGKTDYYWYALGVSFNGMLMHPNGLTLKSILDDVVSSLLAAIPEPRSLELLSLLEDVEPKIKVLSSIYGTLIVNVKDIDLNIKVIQPSEKLNILLKTKDVVSSFLLRTPFRTNVFIAIKTPDASVAISLRTTNIGKIDANTGNARSNIVISSTTGSMHLVLYSTARIEARIPFNTFIDLYLDNVTPSLKLKTPVPDIIHFMINTESVSGGFKMVTAIKGTMSAVTQFVIPRIYCPLETGTLQTYTNSPEVLIYIAHRDEQLLVINSTTATIEPTIKLFSLCRFTLSSQLKNDYFLGEGKVPVPLDMLFKFNLSNVLIDLRLHNSKSSMIVLVATTKTCVASIGLNHPVIGKLKSETPSIISKIEGTVPFRTLISFVTRTNPSLPMISMAVPVYGVMTPTTPDIVPIFKGVTFYAVFRPRLENIEPKIKVMTIVNVRATVEFKTKDITSVIYGKQDSFLIFESETQDSVAEFKAHTYVRPPDYEVDFTGQIQDVLSKILASNPTQGLRLNATTFLDSYIRLALTTDLIIDTVTEDISRISFEIKVGGSGLRISSALADAIFNAAGSGSISIFLKRTLDNAFSNFLFSSPHTRHGEMNGNTGDISLVINIMSIINHFTGTSHVQLENVKFIYIYLRVPYRIFGLLDSSTHNIGITFNGDVSRGGRLAALTPRVESTILFSNLSGVLNPNTGSVIFEIELLNPRTQIYFRRVLEDSTSQIRLLSRIVARLATRTADLRLFQFVIAENTYGKMVGYDHLVGDPKEEFDDPRWLGRYTLVELQGFRVIQHDMLKCTAYVEADIQLYTPLLVKGHFIVDLGSRPNKPNEPGYIGYDNPPMFVYEGTPMPFSDAAAAFKGRVPIVGKFEERGGALTVDCLIAMVLEIMIGTMHLTTKETTAKIKLRAGGAEGLFNVFTNPINFYMAMRAVMPAYLRATLQLCSSDIYITVPFHSFGYIRTNTSDVKPHIIGEVREYRWMFILATPDEPVMDVRLRTEMAIKVFNPVTADSTADFRLAIKYIVLKFENTLRHASCYIKMVYTRSSVTNVWMLVKAGDVLSDIQLQTDAYSIFHARTENCYPSILLNRARPLELDFFGMMDYAQADFRLAVVARAYMDATLQNAFSDINLEYIVPIGVRADLVLDSVTSVIIGYIPVKGYIDATTESISIELKLMYRTFGHWFSELDGSVFAARINVYDKPAEAISDVYYSIEGDIIPDSSSKPSDKKGYIRVYDGDTGEVIQVQHLSTVSFEVTNLIEGEYSVVFDPDSERRVKTHTTVVLGD